MTAPMPPAGVRKLVERARREADQLDRVCCAATGEAITMRQLADIAEASLPRPIAEAKRDGTWLLVGWAGKPWPAVRVAWTKAWDGWFDGHDMITGEPPTHWWLLPQEDPRP